MNPHENLTGEISTSHITVRKESGYKKRACHFSLTALGLFSFQSEDNHYIGSDIFFTFDFHIMLKS